jgi:ATP-dependent Clp protease ATP-binding subunit ClpC
VFDRFTEAARNVIVASQEQARQLEHSYIGTEHLLLALLDPASGAPAAVLQDAGVNPTAVRQAIQRLVRRRGLLRRRSSGSSAPAGRVPFTRRAKKVLELSLREAIALHHDHIGSEHILLGLIHEGQGLAARILLDAGVDLSALRRLTLESLDDAA